jgi:hypothetical protein
MILEAAIFFATLTYVMVASRQLGVMRDTLKQQENMIEQNGNLIAAAKKQADAAVAAAKSAESQASAMIATLPMMQTQANALISAQAAKIQADSSKAQVEAMAEGNKNALNSLRVAQAALEETQKSFQIDQRPYLVVDERPLFTGPIVKKAATGSEHHVQKHWSNASDESAPLPCAGAL